jgi:hypothetical protein
VLARWSAEILRALLRLPQAPVQSAYQARIQKALGSWLERIILDVGLKIVGGASLMHLRSRAPFSAGERRWWREELACGHDVMLDMPNELTALLLQRS